MTIKELSAIICKEGTMAESRHINILTYIGDHTLWSGQAKDLKMQSKLEDYEVVEIRVDHYDEKTSDFPDYNKGKNIYVV